MSRSSSARPVARLLAVAGARRVDLAARSGCSLDTLDRIDRGDLVGMKLGTLARVAAALGVAPAEIAPGLAVRPRGGLVQEATKIRD